MVQKTQNLSNANYQRGDSVKINKIQILKLDFLNTLIKASIRR